MTAPTNLFHAKTHANIQTLINALTAGLPTSVPAPIGGAAAETFSGFDFLNSPGFEIHLKVTPDGQNLVITCRSGDQGQSNAFGAVDGTAVQPAGTVQHYLRSPAITIPASLIT